MPQKLTANYHTHTRRCKHAAGTDREYVEAAIAAGLQVLGFSDHMPWPGNVPGVEHSRMAMRELDDYFSSLTALRREYQGQIELHIGFETENFDLLPQQLRLLEDYPCEYLILGHHFSGYGADAHYFGRPFSDPALLENYTAHVVDGIRSGVFLYLAHPDMPDWRGERALLDAAMERICLAAKEQALPLEINILGQRTGRNYPTEAFFRRAAAHGCTFCVGVDAHTPEHFAEPAVFERALRFAESFGRPVVQRFSIPAHCALTYPGKAGN